MRSAGRGRRIQALGTRATVIIHFVHEGIGPLGDAADGCPGEPLGVGQQPPSVAQRLLQAVAAQYLQQSPLPHSVSGHLSRQVAAPLGWRAHVAQDYVKNGLNRTTTFDQSDRRDNQALLIDLSCQGHGTGRHPTHVSMVRAAGNKELRARYPVGKDRRHHSNVGQVRAAQVGIVEHDQIAGRPGVKGVQRSPHRGGHSAQVYRNVGRLGDHLPIGEEAGTREITPFLDVGTIGRPPQGSAHLLGYGDKEVLEDFERDWVHLDRLSSGVAAAYPCSTNRLPQPSTAADQPGGTIVVVSNWNSTAGPTTTLPGSRRSRSYRAAGIGRVAWGECRSAK